MTLALLFTAMSVQYHLPNGLLSSLCLVESGHNPSAIHFNDGKSHSYGVCQIKYETAQGLGFKGTPSDLMLPKNNIRFAAAYLSKQIKRYHGNIPRAVIAYNRGSAKSLTTSPYQVKVFNNWRLANNDAL